MPLIFNTLCIFYSYITYIYTIINTSICICVCQYNCIKCVLFICYVLKGMLEAQG